MEINVREGENKSNSNNLREMANGEEKLSEDRMISSNILNGINSFE
jgi:hypothetical protein